MSKSDAKLWAALERLDDDLLRSGDSPMENVDAWYGSGSSKTHGALLDAVIDAVLLDAGIDPEEVGKQGAAFVAKLARARRMALFREANKVPKKYRQRKDIWRCLVSYQVSPSDDHYLWFFSALEKFTVEQLVRETPSELIPDSWTIEKARDQEDDMVTYLVLDEKGAIWMMVEADKITVQDQAPTLEEENG